jgi:GNAT superfamily N-acetyltransferase
MKHPLAIRFISAPETWPLRLAVLRPNRPPETAHFPGDDLPTTKHFGAFRHEELVGIASLFSAEMPGHRSATALQLRGMATVPEARRQGVGRALVRACLEYACAQHADILWMNARLAAVPFYRKLGFVISGEKFGIPDVGPHFRMWQRLKP